MTRRRIGPMIVAAAAVVGSAVAPATPVSASFPDQAFTQTACESDTDSVARLYAAALGRDPEAGGFQFWVEEYAAGNWTLPRMAQFFVESPEFQEKYGSLDDRAFVELLYRNVHQRNGDAEGIDFWVGALAEGTTRATVLLRFSESPENVANTGSVFPALGAYNEGRSGAFVCGPDMASLLLTPDQLRGYVTQESFEAGPWVDEVCFEAMNLPDAAARVGHVVEDGAASIIHELHAFPTRRGVLSYMEGLQLMINDCAGGGYVLPDGSTMSFHAEISTMEHSEIVILASAPDGTGSVWIHRVRHVGLAVSAITYAASNLGGDLTFLHELDVVHRLRAAGY